jgi:hypothetical protein
MITQQEIVDRLNQLTLRYNITWQDIKYDADKAITKINNFMGTKYPKMSEILLSADSTYTLGYSEQPDNDGDVAYGDYRPRRVYEIFPEEYIHSIVIPFIAMEILARDEEFTTIFNKYAAEVEEGLFNMFQNEFNRVPFIFRQNPDQGVFFPSGSSVGKRIRHNLKEDMPTFKFRVYYHINNPEITLGSGVQFISDTNAYLYQEEATIKGIPEETFYISADGIKAFHFNGWTRGRNQFTGKNTVGDKIKMISDVHLYAQWREVSTLSANILGEVSIKSAYAPYIINLVIPDTLVDPYPLVSLVPNFAAESPFLERIVLPKYLLKIPEYCFAGFQGREIIFPEHKLSENDPGIRIEKNAFYNTPNLTYIYLPYRVTAIKESAFPSRNVEGVSLPRMTIACERLEENKPDGWESGWYHSSYYTVRWGYSG